MIRTILGDIDPTLLGLCDFHEHFFRTYGPEIKISNDFYLNNIDCNIKEISYCCKYGINSYVCMDPIGCGRDVAKMIQLANYFKDQAHFIMCTGFHKGQLYDPFYHWSQKLTFAQVLELLCLDITEGMDEFSYTAPVINRLPYKAGLVKAGLSYKTITSFEINALKLATHVSLETKAPISIHTEYGSMCLEAIDILKKEGANLSKVVFCHMHRNLDLNYFKSILDTGASLCFDGLNRPQALNEEQLLNILEKLQNLGYKHQLLLSMDAGRQQYHRQENNGYIISNGVGYLFDFVNKNQSICGNLMIDNPREILNCF